MASGQLSDESPRLAAVLNRAPHQAYLAGAHIGPAYRDQQGVAGDDVTLVFRMLQARPLRRELADTGAELALMISPYVYETLVRRDPDLGDRGTFRPVRTYVKRMRIRAWLHVPM